MTDDAANSESNNSSQTLMLKPAEISTRYAICKASVYRLIEAGTLPHVKFGKAIRVPVEAMDKFVADQLADDAATQAEAA